MKPAAAIYHHCLTGVGSSAQDALFLDDRPENIEAARALGIHAVQFQSAAQVADELESRYALPSLPLLRSIPSPDAPASAS
jgi:putative hydrolase of the HAD superfamily